MNEFKQDNNYAGFRIGSDCMRNAFFDERSSAAANSTTSNVSQNITVEKISQEDVSSQQGSGSASTHKIMGEDGYYYIVDDNGNILESLGRARNIVPMEIWARTA